MTCISLRRVLAIVATVLCLSTWALAADDSRTGPDGNPGIPGIAGNPPVAGGNGGDGGSANADAGATVPNDDSYNYATANGGDGGRGGQGGNATGANQNGGNGGDGGDGGDASAIAVTNSDESNVSANATATGGDGGNGGTGGAGNGTGSQGNGGNGGNGGDAQAQASATDSASGFLQIEGDATGGAGGLGVGGGNGGDGGDALVQASGADFGFGSVTVGGSASGGSGGNGFNGGDGGSAGVSAPLTATALNAGSVSVYLQAWGGFGGSSTDGTGGDGASVNLTNAVSAFSTGSVSLTQSARGGGAGGSTGGGLAGVAGNASSSLIIDAAHNNQTGATSLDFTSEVFGGEGGDANVGTAGGSATASADITDSGAITLDLTCRGGFGGRGLAGNGGDGGLPTLGIVHATSTTPGSTSGANITVIVMGGSGGAGGSSAGATGGLGASISLNNTISASIDPNGELQLSQTAIAGRGGDTIFGGPTGGVSGNATSELSVSQEATSLTVISNAAGGAGGALQLATGTGVAFHGGAAFSSAIADSLNNGQTIADAYSGGGAGGAGMGRANGGSGGGATATASAIGGDYDLSQDVAATAEADGGSGGSADGHLLPVGSIIAGNGGTASANAFGSSAHGSAVTVSATENGGSGGAGYNGADGGNGADVTMFNSVNGSTTGALDLMMVGQGGRGGGAVEGHGAAGLAGDANVTLSIDQTTESIQSRALSGSAMAMGGYGGSAEQGDGTVGGSANAAVTLRADNQGSLSASAIATGGGGGSAAGGASGAGGSATASAAAFNLSGYASAFASATGGSVSSEQGLTQGGAGGSVSLINTVSGSSPLELDLQQDAVGGDGGNASSIHGIGGAGGDAVSNLTASNPGGGRLVVTLAATGGMGGFSHDLSGNSIGAPAGTASAIANLTSADGLSAVVSTLGGAVGGIYMGHGPSVPGGDATAIVNGVATAASPLGMDLQATALGGDGFPSSVGITGNSGAALARASGTEDFAASLTPQSSVGADASANGGLVDFIHATAVAPVNGGTSTVESRAAVGRPVPSMSLANGLQAASFVTGMPSRSDVKALEAGHDNIQETFAGDGVTFIGVVDLAAKSYSATPGTPSEDAVSFTSTALLNFHADQLPASELELGLLDGIATDGEGFQQLTFSIEVAGIVVETDNFSTLAGAVAFFHDHVIDLGEIDPGQPISSLLFSLTLQSTGGGDGFNGQFIVAAVPEPSTFLLVGTGAAIAILSSLLRRRRAYWFSIEPRSARPTIRAG